MEEYPLTLAEFERRFTTDAACRTTFAEAKGIPLIMAVPQSGPITMRSWSRA